MFIVSLDQSIKSIKMEMLLHKKHGTTKEDLKNNASPKRYREIAGPELPPMLKMIIYYLVNDQ